MWPSLRGVPHGSFHFLHPSSASHFLGSSYRLPVQTRGRDCTNQKRSYAFAPCPSLTSLVVRSKVSGIGTGAFLWQLLRYDILSVVKHFIAYGTVSRLFGATKQYCFEITIRLQGRLSCMLHRPTQGWTVIEYILRCQSIQASSTVQPRVGR